jgi:Zn-finger nucleic acid-binding protein
MRLEESKEHFSCDYCGSLYFPEPNADGVRVLGEPADLKCPVCKVGMVHAAVGGQRIVYCERCRGMLVPMESFVVIVHTLRKGPDRIPEPARKTAWNDLRREIQCPRCLEPMQAHPYAGPGNVIIDNCPGCSLNWLDHSELKRIAGADGGNQKAEAWSLPGAG